MKWSMERPNIDRVGLSYMLMGEARQGQNASPAKSPADVKEWFYVGPHIMIVLPDSIATHALRETNQDLANDKPYTSLLSTSPGSTPIWVIPVANHGTRLREEIPK